MSTRLFALRTSVRFLLPIIAFLFSAIAGISVAAWLDAPNAPPNYGLTPPYTQNDFRPMNLGTSPQTKNGSMAIVGTLIATSTAPTSFPDFPGNIVASGFYDSEDTGYFLDPATISGYSGVFSSSVGIRQRYPGASLSVNNYYDPLDLSHAKETSGKVGSSGDAIYAYTNSTGAALSAEQANPVGYAVYASGGINYFQGNVGIGIQTPTALLHIKGNNPLVGEMGFGDVLGNLWFDGGTDGWATITNKSSIAGARIGFLNNTSVENMSILNTGNVGIGTATPGAKLDVNGKIRLRSDFPVYNTNGPYNKVGVCANYQGGQGGNPDCTCGTNVWQQSNICTFNSFASGGNNFFSCVYSCEITNSMVITKITECGINFDGSFSCTPIQ